VVVEQYGGPNTLQVLDRPAPEPGPGELSVDVRYAGVNFTDVRNRVGDGLGRVPFTPGVEVSGRVRALGSGVSGFRVGQPVAAFTRGSGYAEVATAPAVLTVAITEEMLDRPDSGGMLITVPVALLLIRRVARITPEDLVLLHSAAGGVGTVVAQIAARDGLRPLLGTVGSPEKAVFAREHGFAEVFTYEEFAKRVMEYSDGRGADVVLDPVGGAARAASFEILAPFGRLVTYSNISREPEVVPDADWMRARCVGYLGFSGGQFSGRYPELMRAALEESAGLVAAGQVDLGVTRVFPLEEVAAAHEVFADRAARGKLILGVGCG
jgi:NADPH2:quinone reductase